MNPESYPNLDSFLIHINIEIHIFPSTLVGEKNKVINSRCWNVEHRTLKARNVQIDDVAWFKNGLSQM